MLILQKFRKVTEVFVYIFITYSERCVGGGGGWGGGGGRRRNYILYIFFPLFVQPHIYV
jgi:hypothetical protein